MEPQVTSPPAYPPITPGPGLRWWRASGRALGAARNDPRAAVGVTLLFLYIVIALVGASFSPYDTTTPNIKVRMQGPSWEHPFGTDRIGRDVATRIIAGSRVSLHVAAGAVIVALLLGAPLGALSSYAGGAFDALVQRVMEGIMAFPSLVLALALVALAGPSVPMLWFAIAFSSVPRYARIVRSGVLTHKETGIRRGRAGHGAAAHGRFAETDPAQHHGAHRGADHPGLRPRHRRGSGPQLPGSRLVGAVHQLGA